MNPQMLADIISTLYDAEEPGQAGSLMEMAIELSATKARYYQLLDILQRPPKEDLSGAFDALTERFEEQMAINEALLKEVRRDTPPEDWSIEALYLGEHTQDILEQCGFHALGDFCKVDRKYLLRIAGIGETTVDYIEEQLERHGLHLFKVTTSPGAAVS